MVKALSFEAGGIVEVLRLLQNSQREVTTGMDLGVIRAGAFVQEEVQDSIDGKKAEPKSVDTTKLIKSIEVEKVSKGVVKIQPKKKTYPGTSTTTQDVALFLEKGTSKISPRSHFKNTLERNRKNIRNIINIEIKQNLAAQKQVFG